tara:strand:+ start:1246 stop:1812 length:567 start_codon:yes stop_codon:yes gene_type:complete
MINILQKVSLVSVFILLLPLLAMQISNEVVWDLADFVVAGVLLFCAGLTYELVARKGRNTTYRSAVGVAVVTALLLVWINLAVGIIGDENNDANMMYVGVLAMGSIGSIMARFQPHGMARAMFATAIAQTLVGVIALIAGLGSMGPIWPRDILILTGFFTALWIGSAWLFRNAAREKTLSRRTGPYGK